MKRLTLSLLCCLTFPLALQAGIEKYFKPAPNKPLTSNVRGIDQVYVINLDQRPEKFAETCRQLEPWGIFPYRFSAVNGWELSFEALNDVGVRYEPWMKQKLWGTYYLPENNGEPRHEIMQVVGRNYFSHCMSRGAVGIVLSHLSILQDAYDSGYQRIWVMEDDIFLPPGQDPHEVSDLIEELDGLLGPQGWDILFTDPDTKDAYGRYVSCYGWVPRANLDPDDPGRFAKRRQLNHTFTRVGARFGAYSMIVNRCGMEKLLNFLKTYQIFFPFDMEFPWPKGICLVATRRDIVSTIPNALSDNGGPRYKDKP